MSMPVRVAFQGEAGAYGDEAIRRRWNGAAASVPSASFQSVVDDVLMGAVDYGILPVWNSIVGVIATGCAAVRLSRSTAYGLIVAGDAAVAVQHQLLAVPGAQLDDIHSALSHPVALAQCGQFFSTHPGIAPVAAHDTAGAARALADSGAPDTAAVASRLAAERYGLAVLREDIQDVPGNTTRFLILARRDLHTQTHALPPSESAMPGSSEMTARW